MIRLSSGKIMWGLYLQCEAIAAMSSSSATLRQNVVSANVLKSKIAYWQTLVEFSTCAVIRGLHSVLVLHMFYIVFESMKAGQSPVGLGLAKLLDREGGILDEGCLS